jgi:predicted methyltransferase
MTQFNRSVLDALKPGGAFVILDHVATIGSGFTRTNDFHRVDPAAVKAEVAAAGFEFAGESDALRNSADDHSRAIFDPSIKGSTDKFIYTFRKPTK